MSENQINRHSKKHFSSEERKNYYIAWKKSELNTTDFCKAHGISKSALYKWTKELEKENNDSGFLPLIIDKKLSVTSANIIKLNIAFSNNPMQISIEMPEQHLVSFIQEMGHATAIIR
jgi:transposase-like protein